MSLRFAHELGLALAVSLALLSVLLGGELPMLLWAAALLPAVSVVLRERGVAPSVWLGTGVALGAFAWAAALLWQGGLDGSLLAAATALVGIAAGRILTRRTPAHDLQALVLSLLLVFAGTVLHPQFTYGVIFVLYAIAVTWALITRQLVAGAEQEATRHGGAHVLDNILGRRDVVTPRFFAVTAVVAMVILLSSSLLFVLFPRVGLGSLAMRGRNNGRLPADVSLFGTPRAISSGDAVVARLRGVTYADYLRGLYLRGGVYDTLDKGGFRRSGTLSGLRPRKLELAPAPREATYELFLEPVTDQLLLVLGPAKAWKVLAGGQGNPSNHARIVGRAPGDELLLDAPLTGPIRYQIAGGISAAPRSVPAPDELAPAAEFDASFAERFLTVPEGTDARLTSLATRLVDGHAGFAARAAALRRYLLENFEYTLTQPNAGKPDPLGAFLFADRRGHCEYFATAFAVLLRAAGVPSRVVGGFAYGTWDEDGQLVVFTGANAHAWVEWYDPAHGWILDDATPEVAATTLTGLAALAERLRRLWDDNVIEFGLQQQVELISAVAASFRAPNMPGERIAWRPVAQTVGAALGLAVASVAWRRLRRGRKGRTAPLTQALVEGLGRVLGEPVPAHWTLRQAVTRAESKVLPPEHSALLWQALACYEAIRFGHAASLTVPRQLLVRLRRLPRSAH